MTKDLSLHKNVLHFPGISQKCREKSDHSCSKMCYFRVISSIKRVQPLVSVSSTQLNSAPLKVGGNVHSISTGPFPPSLHVRPPRGANT